jgi:hypothetical protein
VGHNQLNVRNLGKPPQVLTALFSPSRFRKVIGA